MQYGEKNILNSIFPIFNKGDGIKLFISYHANENLDCNRKVTVCDIITPIGEEGFSVIEYNAIELKKSLRLLNDDLLFPSDIKFILYNDNFINFPLIRHSRKHFPDNLKNTLKAMAMVLKNLVDRNIVKVISLNIGWETESKEIRLSILGHNYDVCNWLEKMCNNLPIFDKDLEKWLNEIRVYLDDNFQINNPVLQLSEVLKDTGILLIKRMMLWEDEISHRLVPDEKGNLDIELEIPKERTDIIENLKNRNIQVASGFITKEIICSKCKKSYIECSDSIYLDSDTTLIIDKKEFPFAFWTNL